MAPQERKRRERKQSREVFDRIWNDPAVKLAFDGLSESTLKCYIFELARWLGKKMPTQLISERKADLRKKTDNEKYRIESLAMAHFRKRKEQASESARHFIKALSTLFQEHRTDLKLTRKQREETGRGKPTFIDYVPTRNDLKKMVEVADVRDRAIILTEASTDASGDICELTRAQFEQGLARRKGPNEPICLAPRGDYLYRKKTEVRMRPFLTNDAIHAIKLYLNKRKDGAPWLFVERTGQKLTPEAVNKMVQRLAKAAALDIPEGQRMRMHNFRDFFEEGCRMGNVPENWIYIMDGRMIAGSGKFYSHAREDEALEKFKGAEQYLSASSISNMTLVRGQFAIALEEHERAEFIRHRDIIGRERFRRWAQYELSMQPMIKWNPETQMEPGIYRRQRILREMLDEEKKAVD